MRRFPRSPNTRPLWVRAVFALACPVVASGLGSLASEPNTTIAAMIYLIGVVVAAVLTGMGGALLASLASFMALNVLFTPPVGTFAVQKAEDIVALFVFLGTSALVAALVTRARDESARAEARERQTSYLYQLASSLLEGEKIDAVLKRLARNLAQLFDLASCEILIEEQGSTSWSERHFEADSQAEAVDIALTTERGSFGRLRLVPRTDQPGTIDMNLAETFAAQVALAIETSRLDAERREAIADAETNRIRAALFSSVTHDLRTPLASIKAAATSLSDDQVTFAAEERSELLTTIAEESDRLNRLIGNLLDLARLRAGALAPSKSPTPIDEVIAGVVQRMRRQLGERKVNIRIRDQVPPVPMDLMQIDQVLTNLLENAIRYTNQDTPIEISALRWQTWVEVAVADRGPGIPEDDRSRVFEEFYRRDLPDHPSGTGLGLAIARAMVNAHGGDIAATVTPGGGTTITFRLPVLEIR